MNNDYNVIGAILFVWVDEYTNIRSNYTLTLLPIMSRWAFRNKWFEGFERRDLSMLNGDRKL